MDKDYLNIYSKILLNKVKEEVKDCFIEKDKNKEKEIDDKILKIIKDLISEINEKRNDNLNIGFFANQLENDKFMQALCMQYVALYNDNINLLNTILSNNIEIETGNLVLLDKKITEKIDEETYINLLKSQKDTILYFIKSLKYEKEGFSNEEAIKRFSNLIKTYPDISFSEDRMDYYIFLTKESLFWFDDDILINASDNQKEIIQDIYGRSKDIYDEEVMITFSTLISKYNFSKELPYLLFGNIYERLVSNFSIEEISNLSDEQIKKIGKIYNGFIIENNKRKKELKRIKKKVRRK